jgi:hypothetical protein
LSGVLRPPLNPQKYTGRLRRAGVLANRFSAE